MKEEACGVRDGARENSETKHSCTWERGEVKRVVVMVVCT